MSRSPLFPWLPPVVLLFLSFTGCAELEEDSVLVVRDSAGIQIVENTGPIWGPDEGWRLSEKPVLTIGVATGAEEYELYGVVSALRLSTGEIAVACGGTYEVRFYDSTGVYLRTVGRQGGGPDEYNLMWKMWRLGTDSLALFDYLNNRITVLGLRGELGRTYIPAHPPGRSTTVPVGPFSDGSFLGRSDWGGAYSSTEGVRRETALLVRWSPEGDLLDTEVSRPAWEQYFRPLEGQFMTAHPPFGRKNGLATSADGWYFGSMDTYEIEYLSPQGNLQRVIRREFENRQVTPENREEWLRLGRERWSQMPAPVLEWRLTMPFPETMPAYGTGWVTDEDQNLWIPEYKLPTEHPSSAVFDPEGRFLGVVDTPVDGRITHIGRDFVLGVWTDETDTEQVRMYGLIKSD